MNVFKSFSIKETRVEIENYIKDFEEFEPFLNVSYEHYMNQIIVNYNFTLRRIYNRIINQKLNKYYYFNYWI